MEELENIHALLKASLERERALELRVADLADFVEQVAMPLHWVDRNGIIVWANQAELEMLGFTSEEYIGQPITLFHADQAIIGDILKRLTADESIMNYPALLRCKDGRIKEVLINSSVKREDGEFIHTRCFTRDMSAFFEEEKRMAEVLVDLEQSEARLLMAMESTGLGTWDYNPQSGSLTWSEQCKKIYGLPLNETVDFSTFSEHIYPEDRGFVQQEIQQSMKPDGDGRYDITYRITRFDDHSPRWIRAQGKVYFNPEGQPERFIGTVDITESKLALEKITRSEKLFKTIALNIPRSFIIVIDSERRVQAIEGDAIQRLGYLAAGYEGKHLSEIGPPGRYEKTKPLYDRMLAGEQFIEERKGANGDDFMVHFVPLKNDAQKVYAGLIIALDISDYKRAEEKSAMLAAIVASSDDAIISKNFDSIITSWNAGAQRLFGYTPAEIIGESVLKLIPPDRQEEEPEILARLKRGERVEHFETKRLTKDGSLLDVSLTISPVKDAQGKVIGLSKIARDITEKKQEDSRKNDFIAMVSHELKTPLTSMRSYIQVLLGIAKKEGSSFQVNALTRADLQAQKMTTMIHDFLNLARLEDGKITLHKTRFALQPLIEEIAADAPFLTSSHQVVLADCKQIFLYADREKIGQVLNNLLSNSIKYSPKGGTVTVGCEMLAERVKIFVRDEGVGISSEDQKHLFERFYRAKDEQIKTVSGFGIGLYLVAEILRYHDSLITVESTVGLGSEFYFIMDPVKQ
ncbi:MAG: putative Histidine kinase [Frankiales bacterium]|nr:putative Histidine kinase [Frankiales bacterium]